MRLNECEQVQKDLSEHLGINLTVVDASQQFLDGLQGIKDPEQKRKFIGMFMVWGSSFQSLNISRVILDFGHGTDINF
jgi:GMP synthase (glutamine-hydrolysing)